MLKNILILAICLMVVQGYKERRTLGQLQSTLQTLGGANSAEYNVKWKSMVVSVHEYAHSIFPALMQHILTDGYDKLTELQQVENDDIKRLTTYWEMAASSQTLSSDPAFVETLKKFREADQAKTDKKKIEFDELGTAIQSALSTKKIKFAYQLTKQGKRLYESKLTPRFMDGTTYDAVRYDFLDVITNLKSDAYTACHALRAEDRYQLLMAYYRTAQKIIHNPEEPHVTRAVVTEESDKTDEKEKNIRNMGKVLEFLQDAWAYMPEQIVMQVEKLKEDEKPTSGAPVVPLQGLQYSTTHMSALYEQQSMAYLAVLNILKGDAGQFKICRKALCERTITEKLFGKDLLVCSWKLEEEEEKKEDKK